MVSLNKDKFPDAGASHEGTSESRKHRLEQLDSGDAEQLVALYELTNNVRADSLETVVTALEQMDGKGPRSEDVVDSREISKEYVHTITQATKDAEASIVATVGQDRVEDIDVRGFSKADEAELVSKLNRDLNSTTSDTLDDIDVRDASMVDESELLDKLNKDHIQSVEETISDIDGGDFSKDDEATLIRKLDKDLDSTANDTLDDIDVRNISDKPDAELMSKLHRDLDTSIQNKDTVADIDVRGFSKADEAELVSKLNRDLNSTTSDTLDDIDVRDASVADEEELKGKLHRDLAQAQKTSLDDIDIPDNLVSDTRENDILAGTLQKDLEASLEHTQSIAYDRNFQAIHDQIFKDINTKRDAAAIRGELDQFQKTYPDTALEVEYEAYQAFAQKYPEDFKKYLARIEETIKNDTPQLKERFAAIKTSVGIKDTQKQAFDAQTELDAVAKAVAGREKSVVDAQAELDALARAVENNATTGKNEKKSEENTGTSSTADTKGSTSTKPPGSGATGSGGGGEKPPENRGGSGEENPDDESFYSSTHGRGAYERQSIEKEDAPIPQSRETVHKIQQKPEGRVRSAESISAQGPMYWDKPLGAWQNVKIETKNFLNPLDRRENAFLAKERKRGLIASEDIERLDYLQKKIDTYDARATKTRIKSDKIKVELDGTITKRDTAEEKYRNYQQKGWFGKTIYNIWGAPKEVVRSTFMGTYNGIKGIFQGKGLRGFREFNGFTPKSQYETLRGKALVMEGLYGDIQTKLTDQYNRLSRYANERDSRLTGFTDRIGELMQPFEKQLQQTQASITQLDTQIQTFSTDIGNAKATIDKLQASIKLDPLGASEKMAKIKQCKELISAHERGIKYAQEKKFSAQKSIGPLVDKLNGYRDRQAQFDGLKHKVLYEHTARDERKTPESLNMAYDIGESSPVSNPTEQNPVRIESNEDTKTYKIDDIIKQWTTRFGSELMPITKEQVDRVLTTVKDRKVGDPVTFSQFVTVLMTVAQQRNENARNHSELQNTAVRIDTMKDALKKFRTTLQLIN